MRTFLLMAALVFALGSGAAAAEPQERSIQRWDPFEPVNRHIHYGNGVLDDWILRPAVQFYLTTTPDFVRQGIGNFFTNVGQIPTFANTILQGRPQATVETAGRFVVNSTIGVAGLFDPASHLGMPRYAEDFGQTLGTWGVGPGPYLVLPLMGPSSLRDGTGLAFDRLVFWFIGVPIPSLRTAQTAATPVQGVDDRSRIGFRYGDLGPFEYDLLRTLYLDYRQALVKY